MLAVMKWRVSYKWLMSLFAMLKPGGLWNVLKPFGTLPLSFYVNLYDFINRVESFLSNSFLTVVCSEPFFKQSIV